MKTEQPECQALLVPAYQDIFEHLRDELMRLDKMLEIRVYEFNIKKFSNGKRTYTSPNYISNEEVNWLMSEQPGVEKEGMKP